MFKPYQSGPFVDLLSAKDKPPRWAFSDHSAHQVYEKGVKGFILVLDSPSLTLTVPADAKKCLGLTQSYLVVQLLLPEAQSFSMELMITDQSSVRRRFLLSSASRDTVISPLHVRTPNKSIFRGDWLNLSIDLPSYLCGCFPTATFRSLDGLVFTGSCRIRRIFTMRSPIWTPEFDVEAWEPVPKQVDFPGGVSFRSQLLRFQRSADLQSHQVSVQEAPRSREKPQTAFGSRAVGKASVKQSQERRTARPSQQRVVEASARYSPAGGADLDYNPWASGQLPAKPAADATKEDRESVGLFRDSPLLKVSLENPLDAANTVHQDVRASTIEINPLEDGDLEALQLPVANYPEYNPEAYTQVAEPASDSEEVELVYDPVLGCYYDPLTREYYEVQT